MPCAKYTQSIQELIDGTLGAIRAAELQQHLERGDEPGPRFARFDHVVQVAAGCGDVRIGQPFAVVTFQLHA